MKYPANTYAQALVEAIVAPKADPAKIQKNFLAIIRKNGDEGRLKAILESAERLLGKKTGDRKVIVESARPLTGSVKSLFGNFLRSSDSVETKIHPELVAGVRITVNDELQFDGSLKGKLDILLNA